MAISQGNSSPSASHQHNDLYYTEAEADAKYALVGHNHDGVYSGLGHNHTGVYSAVGHTHAYAADDHNHAVDALSNVYTTGKTDGQSLVWSAGNNRWQAATVSSGGGVTDHGALTGLADDDHAQYHNNARGDARYSLLAHNHDGVYAAAAHSHGTSTITDDSVTNAKLANMAQATVKGRANAAGTGDPVDLTAAQLIAIISTADGVSSGLDADMLDGNQASAFALASHDHNSTYYTEAEITSLLAGKANTSHTHDDRYYTESEMSILLSSKADDSHLHSTGAFGSDWTTTFYTLGTGWGTVSDPNQGGEFRIKRIGNMALLSGTLSRNSSISTYKTIATLDAAWRPVGRVKAVGHFGSTVNTPGTLVTVSIDTDGTVRIWDNLTSLIPYLGFDSIFYPLD